MSSRRPSVGDHDARQIRTLREGSVPIRFASRSQSSGVIVGLRDVGELFAVSTWAYCSTTGMEATISLAPRFNLVAGERAGAACSPAIVPPVPITIALGEKAGGSRRREGTATRSP